MSSKQAFEQWWEKIRLEKSGALRRPTREEIWQHFRGESQGEALSEQKFRDWWIADPFKNYPRTTGDILWQYFAPHLKGEFPREAALSDRDKLVIGDQFRSWYANQELPEGFEYLPAATILDWFFERLWNGGEEVSSRREPASGTLLSDVCQTCGGNKRICDFSKCHLDHDAKYVPAGACLGCEIEPLPCPDCTEKWKCLRCGDSLLLVCPAGLEHRFVDQRKGQQRKGEESSSVCYYPGAVDQESYAGFSFQGWYGRPDRREGDRRKQGDENES